MSKKTYEIIELVGTSDQSIENAIQNAIAYAGKHHDNHSWFTVEETRGHIRDGKIAYYQVTVKLGRACD